METLSKDNNSRLANFECFDKNPYVTNIVINKRNKNIKLANSNDWSLINTETGEEKITFLTTKQEVDKEEFIKIYRNKIQFFFGLSVSAIKLFGYIVENVGINSDIIILNIKDVMKYTGYKTRNTIYKSVIELLSNEILAKTCKSGVFYINPTIFFNGNRLVLIKEYNSKK